MLSFFLHESFGRICLWGQLVIRAQWYMSRVTAFASVIPPSCHSPRVFLSNTRGALGEGGNPVLFWLYARYFAAVSVARVTKFCSSAVSRTRTMGDSTVMPVGLEAQWNAVVSPRWEERARRVMPQHRK